MALAVAAAVADARSGSIRETGEERRGRRRSRGKKRADDAYIRGGVENEKTTKTKKRRKRRRPSER